MEGEEGGGRRAPGRKVRGFASRRRGGAGEAEQLRNQPPSGAEKLRHRPREPSVRAGGCTLGRSHRSVYANTAGKHQVDTDLRPPSPVCRRF